MSMASEVYEMNLEEQIEELKKENTKLAFANRKLLTDTKQQQAELDETKGHMAWALKMLYDQEKGNPVFEEMCDKYIRGKWDG